MSRSLANTVFFAGEHLHEEELGTVQGALETGTHAADALLRSLHDH